MSPTPHKLRWDRIGIVAIVFIGLVWWTNSKNPTAGVASGPAATNYSDAISKGDYTTAVRLLRPLAEGGDKSAQNNLGKLYQDGRSEFPPGLMSSNPQPIPKRYRACRKLPTD